MLEAAAGVNVPDAIEWAKRGFTAWMNYGTRYIYIFMLLKTCKSLKQLFPIQHRRLTSTGNLVKNLNIGAYLYSAQIITFSHVIRKILNL